MTDTFMQGRLLFTGEEKRDRAIEANDAQVASEVGGDELVKRVTASLVGGTQYFTADHIAKLLDEHGVSLDLKTRRKLTSTIINRGRGKYWRRVGYTTSEDPRRNARPITLWELTDAPAP